MVENFLYQNLDVGIGMLEENLIRCGQEIFDHFLMFIASELMKVNIGHAKINLLQFGVNNFKYII